MTDRKFPVSLITGFLGSGKTTVINHLLAAPEMARTAVLVNEFGQISIDGDLIARSDETVVELKNGCVCCSLNQDLGETLHDFLRKRRSGEMPLFEKILIETTGLANAGPIARVIMEDPLIRDDFVLDRIVTTVDSVHGVTNLNLHAESVEQVAVADRLILTKLDRVETEEFPENLSTLRARLRNLNPSAPLIEGKRGVVDVTALFDIDPTGEMVRFADPSRWASASRTPAHHHSAGENRDGAVGIDVHRHDHHIGSFCIVRDRPVPPGLLENFLAALAEEAGPNLLRVKGLVNVAGHPETPAVVQGVQQVFDDTAWLPEWPSGDRRTRLVFIGWMLDEGGIRRMLDEAEVEPDQAPGDGRENAPGRAGGP